MIACERGRVKYGTTQGDAEFREKISKHASLMYDVKVSPKDVLVKLVQDLQYILQCRHY